MVYIIRFFTFIAIILYSSNSFAQTAAVNCEKATTLLSLLKEHHVASKPLNDSLSSDIFNNFFHLLDINRHFFTNSDLQGFDDLAYTLDDLLNEKKCDFLDSITLRFKHRIHETVSLLEQMKDDIPSLEEVDTFRVSYNVTSPYAIDKLELKARWVSLVRYFTLNKVINKDTSLIKSFDSFNDTYLLECNKQIQNIKRKLLNEQGLHNYVYHKFLQAIATAHDPHSAYFSTKEKQKFETANATDAPSFGIDLEEDASGYVKIARLIPGSSAWRSNQLNEGDVLLSLTDPVGKLYDLTFYDLYEIIDLLESIGSQINLSVSKINGEQITVLLQKELLRVDQNVIKSLLLTKNDTSFAYINLPGFYTKDEFNQSGAANDLAKEILKLKKENIQGIILDIRNNGGGDMQEALDIAGIFIDRGTLSIYRQYGKDITLKDSNLGTVYDGPLVVMVNGASASASELIAGTLQDHNRALIVGTPTFGKATGQNIKSMATKNPKADFVKITTLRFYRVTGRSHQKYGVVPNVYLPDVFEGLSYREHSLPFALAPDMTNKKAYYYPLRSIKLDSIIIRSKNRVSSNPSFQNIFNVSNHLNNYIKKGGFFIPLQKEAFLAFLEVRELNNTLSLEENHISQIDISFSSYDNDVNAFDKYSEEIFNVLKKNVLNDPYIEESFNIITDYIKFNKQ